MMNGAEEIYFEKKGHLHLSPKKFSADQLRAAVLNIAQYVGRRVSEEEPYLDARLPDGSRVAILLPPCSRKGISVSIRKFAKEGLTVEKLLDFGSLTREMVTFLKAAVVLKKNIIISGGTSSGKTSLLNVISSLIPNDERILTIEDSAELQLMQEHVVPMETKAPDKKGRGQITIRDLVKASLRMRPDRIVVGEIRGGEALDLLQAMNTGHSGSMATLHASSPSQALTRLETLALFSGLEIPIRALREQVSTAIDIVVQASRLPDRSRKVVYISEVGRLKEDGSYHVDDIFRFARSGTENGKIIGQHEWTGCKPSFYDEIEMAGLADAVALFQK
ncbi:MAG: CpaF family protein [Bdellovibrionales bacterium]|nr:CpaF family protein [Bdellovibrionales bacterium]